MRLRGSLPPVMVAVTACATMLTACSGGQGSPHRSAPPTSASVPAPAGTSTSTTKPACTNASVVAGWPIARRASLLLVAPVLDFDMGAAHVAAVHGAGGILFLGTATPPADLAARLRATFAGGAAPSPIAMADQEGGGIQRLTPPVASSPWPRTMASTMTTSQVQALAARVGSGMKSLGVSMDLAPVADVDARSGPSSSNPDGQRSFSGDPATVSAYAIAFMQGMVQAGEIPAVKHFPGLGGSTGNTDNGPAATLPLSTLESGGLAPFQAEIAAGAPAVMVANAAVPGLTALPASLSPDAIGGLLRGRLGFAGLVVTDSLSARAISAAGYDLPRAAVAAVAAGADMVLFGSALTPADRAQLAPPAVAANLQAMTSAITAAVASGQIPASRLDSADGHVLAAEHISLC